MPRAGGPPARSRSNRTRIIDLRRDELQLWSDLRASTRKSLGRARRGGYEVVEVGAAGLDEFEALYLETARRVGFAPAADREVFGAWVRRDQARLLLARGPGGEAAATLMLLDCGDRVLELYGGSSGKRAQDRTNHLVKWEAIRSSRDRGMARYDMWGTDAPGVAWFKSGFGGAERRYIGAWRLITDPRANALLGAAEQGRVALRWLRRRFGPT